jgi:hypothetical protein
MPIKISEDYDTFVTSLVFAIVCTFHAEGGKHKKSSKNFSHFAVLEKQEGRESVFNAANLVVLITYSLVVHARSQPYLHIAAALSRVKEYDRV